MASQLAVDNKNELTEFETPPATRYPLSLRIAAKIISYIFHPVFIPVYLVWILVYGQPYTFAGFSKWGKTVIVMQAVLWYTFFPLVTVLLLKGVGFIKSIFLTTRRDRIAPYIICMIWYWWGFHVRRNLPDSPPELVTLTYAIFLSCIGGFFANIYTKISMHTIAAGVGACFIIWQGFTQDLSMGIYISAAILVTGLICTARFIDSNHTSKEIYSGLFVGIASMLIAIYIRYPGVA